eukprot:snap_masked-scaffold_38-processed-gene-1.31-mRNA-1 protein AED:1.00 eAED:1.00 QI:0/0/0/0/1/1/3/0/94
MKTEGTDLLYEYLKKYHTIRGLTRNDEVKIRVEIDETTSRGENPITKFLIAVKQVIEKIKSESQKQKKAINMLINIILGYLRQVYRGEQYVGKI